MLRRLHTEQPASFAFTPANLRWAEAQIQKYPEGRQASAVIPLLWRAQEQEGWLSKPAIEEVARMLGLAYIRVLEVATFYFMFQLSPVGSVAHIQICGTTPCMLCGSEDLIEFCKTRISQEPHHPSADGKFSWEEVECLGACANAPMAQIGKDYYEDLTVESLGRILDELGAGRVPQPGSQIGRFASEPEGGPTALTQYAGEGREAHNASVELALAIGDTVKRIDGTEVPFRAPWLKTPQPEQPAPAGEVDTATPPDGETSEAPTDLDREHTARPPGVRQPLAGGETVAPAPVGHESGVTRHEAGSQAGGTVPAPDTAAPLVPEVAPPVLTAPRDGVGDNLQEIAGVGPKLEALLHDLGFWHFDQIAAWSPGEVAWVNSRLGAFRGRIEREHWIDQARKLAGQ
ncbi:NADH-ubiquinone oxidoreductase chain E [Rubellimicrobium mesophilum DSM 19309]|uniref:NADH-ubiquinone oxidoreductase chain E n=1 Tax=Rubellimicrobium mesophilum DSM 19309 TaxID=442562 RepID=A0A017HTG9_9RHOB|nr:NADH-quinone oxidoreductase subunit E [Rubellimicrobium mesophilum]EYD77807.1 NADH-ubiquinone oxidoreductase chain E [Rubellimicrobium mesophilum DSM 19309]